MHVVYTLQDAPESFTSAIFLAGPTPRDPETPSWRPGFLETGDVDWAMMGMILAGRLSI